MEKVSVWLNHINDNLLITYNKVRKERSRGVSWNWAQQLIQITTGPVHCSQRVCKTPWNHSLAMLSLHAESEVHISILYCVLVTALNFVQFDFPADSRFFEQWKALLFFFLSPWNCSCDVLCRQFREGIEAQHRDGFGVGCDGYFFPAPEWRGREGSTTLADSTAMGTVAVPALLGRIALLLGILVERRDR